MVGKNANFENKTRILYATNSNLNAKLFTRYLEKKCLVEIACDGVQAMNKLSQNNYPLLITDTQLPLISGLDLSVSVREKKYVQNIILIGAQSKKELADKYKFPMNIVNEYFQIPLNMHAVVEVVLKNLNGNASK